MTTNTQTRKLKIAITVITSLLVISLIIMSVFLGLYTSDRSKLRNNIESIYQQSYYTLVEDIVRIEQALCKLQYTSTPNLMRSLMEEASRNSTSATAAINTMNTGKEELRTLLHFFNQVGDYNQYLLRKININFNKPDKKYLDDSDYKSLGEMADICREIGRNLNKMQDKINEGHLFIDILGSDNDFFGEIIGSISGEGMTYPSLIYDGPFSDGIKDRPAKGISGDNISQEQALALVAKYLPNNKILSAEVVGESNNRIPSYNISCQIDAERNISMQISKQGGSLLLMDADMDITEPTIDIQEAERRAEQYCVDIGMNNMKAVWATNSNSTIYINLCYTDDGAIIYPDMVKVKVALDTGEIIGFEGLNYAYNHTERTITKPIISEVDAILGISSKLSELTSRLAIIPLTLEREVLCYEIAGKINGDIYFIYVDATTGEEVNILRVIDSDQGELLM